VLSLLLSQERVVTLLYAKTFPVKSVGVLGEERETGVMGSRSNSVADGDLRPGSAPAGTQPLIPVSRRSGRITSAVSMAR